MRIGGCYSLELLDGFFIPEGMEQSDATLKRCLHG